jgi:hypothetical protein
LLLYYTEVGSLVPGIIVTNSPLVTPLKPLILGVVTCDLLFRRWLGLEINRITREVITSLMVTDNKGYINIIELYQLVGFIN